MAISCTLIAALLITAGGFFCIWVGGVFVGWAIERFLVTELADPQGMKNAGRAIGWAERTLIYVFILGDATTAIGLLVAAKSIMRIGETRSDRNEGESDEPSDRRAMTEYVIFGTLVSFAWAVTVASIFRWILVTWVV